MATRKETLEIGGREVTVTNPDKIYFPRAGHTKLDLVQLLPRGRRRGPDRRPRPADGAQALRRRRREGAVLPEARARTTAPTWIRTRDADLPLRPDRRRDRPRRGGGPRLGRQPRLPRPQPAPGPRRGPGPPRRAAGGPRPGARRALVAGPRGGARDPGGARRRRARRLAEDLRLARDPHQRPDRAALDVPAGPAGRAGAGARRRAAGARRSPPPSGGRRSATGCSSTTTRTPRTGRSRPPTPSGRRPTPGSRSRCAGTRCPTW